MANFAQSLKDPKILMLRAEFNSAHKAVDKKNVEIDKLISYIEQAKKDNTVPKEFTATTSDWISSSSRATTSSWHSLKNKIV